MNLLQKNSLIFSLLIIASLQTISVGAVGLGKVVSDKKFLKKDALFRQLRSGEEFQTDWKKAAIGGVATGLLYYAKSNFSDSDGTLQKFASKWSRSFISVPMVIELGKMISVNCTAEYFVSGKAFGGDATKFGAVVGLIGGANDKLSGTPFTTSVATAQRYFMAGNIAALSIAGFNRLKTKYWDKTNNN